MALPEREQEIIAFMDVTKPICGEEQTIDLQLGLEQCI